MKIRKLTAAVLAFAMLCPVTAALPAAAETEAWRTAYQNILKDNDNGTTDEMLGVKYSIADIVGDGKPELMLSNGNFHMATVKVYTFYHGKAVMLEEMCENGEMMLDLTTGELVSSYMGQGNFWEQRFAHFCGALVPTIGFADNDGTMDPHFYQINGKDVSKAEYFEERSILSGHKYRDYGREYAASNLDPVNSFKVTNPVAMLGDVNNDRSVNASDAAKILIGAATYGAESRTGLTFAQEDAADVNSDHKINASDAAIVLLYAAEAGAAKDGVSLTDFS